MEGLRPETEAAVQAVQEALALASRGPRTTSDKTGRDVVTDADLAAEELVRETLATSGDLTVVGEELGGEATPNSRYWLVDPICGTRNFASRIPMFCVNVALVEDGNVTVGVVGDGATGSVYLSESGAGAFEVDGHRRRRIRTSAGSRTISLGWPVNADDPVAVARYLHDVVRADHWDVRVFGTTLSLAYVANGGLDATAFFSTPSSLHTAAGAHLAREAGGTVTDLAGDDWDPRSTSLVASADRAVHDQLLGLLAG